MLRVFVSYRHDSPEHSAGGSAGSSGRPLECSDLSELSLADEPPRPTRSGRAGDAGRDDAASPRTEGNESGDKSPHSKACDAVTERAAEALKIVLNGSRSLLTIALDHLTLARATLYRALLDSTGQAGIGREIQDSQSELNQDLTAAVDGFRTGGRADYLPRGLLTRAWQRKLCGDAARIWTKPGRSPSGVGCCCFRPTST